MLSLSRISQITAFFITSACVVVGTSYAVVKKELSFISDLEAKDSALKAHIKSKQDFIINNNSIKTTQTEIYLKAKKEYQEAYKNKPEAVDVFIPSDVLDEMLLKRTKDKNESAVKLSVANKSFDETKQIIYSHEKSFHDSPNKATKQRTREKEQPQIYKDFEAKLHDKRVEEKRFSIFSLLINGIQNIKEAQEKKFPILQQKSNEQTNAFNILESTKHLIEIVKKDLQVLQQQAKDSEEELLKYKTKTIEVEEPNNSSSD